MKVVGEVRAAPLPYTGTAAERPVPAAYAH